MFSDVDHCSAMPPGQAAIRHVAFVFAILSVPLCVSAGESGGSIDFARDIQPMLAENCFECHGPDAAHRQADLRLDVESVAKQNVIVPGDSVASELMVRISSDDDEILMPPPDSRKKLSEKQRALFKQWIDQGAPWKKHWAFESPVRTEAPPFASDWVRNPIDQFILKRIYEQGLSPSAPASRSTLYRRLHLDLIGLPPDPEALQNFLADTSDEALASAIEAALHSPHYGERVAIDWLDVARYADTNGYQNDFFRSMWPWRDWVIDAMNRNLPYDEFILHQIAGDMLEDPTREQLIATGFNRNHRMVTEGGSIEAEWHVENVIDRAETTSAAFLGLTVGCARCHDHKYDPISQKEFYRFFAFFNNVDEQGVYIERRGNVPPLIQLPSEQNSAKLAEFDAEIQRIEKNVAESASGVDALLDQWRRESDSINEVRPNVTLSLPDLRVISDMPVLPITLETAAVNPGFESEFEPGPTGVSTKFYGAPESYLDLGQVFSLSRESAGAWSFWVKPDSPGAIISKMDDANGYRGFDTLLLPDYRIQVHLVHRWPDDAIAVVSKSALPPGKWSHVTVSYDGSSKAEGLLVYVDGAKVDLNVERNSLVGAIDTEQPLRIGRRSSDNYLKGSVGRFRLYARSLTDDQIVGDLKHALLTAFDLGRTDSKHINEVVQRFVARDLERELGRIQEEREKYSKQIQTTMVMRERDDYRPTYRLNRGQYDLPDESEMLWPAVPECLPQLKDDQPPNRLGLARWMIDPDNPLVARIAVNQVWKRLMGRELFSSENVGTQSDPPTHPELLDWLARWFIDSGWDLKALHRLIVSSATYQQSSDFTPTLVQDDPENRWYARASRFRLPAELIRDNALAISGLLNRKIGGPSVKPYQPAGLWMELAGGANDGPYQADAGEGLYRRSLYIYRKRTVSHPTMSTFDAPSWEICQVKRGLTNTPLQSLALLNDVTYVEAARKLAERMFRANPAKVAEQIGRGFQLALLREPSLDELERLEQTYLSYLEYYKANPVGAKELLGVGFSLSDDSAPPSQHAAMTLTALVLLNLDETITRE